MAFTATQVYQNVVGNEREIRGTYENTGGSTGGEVLTGLGEVRDFALHPKGNAILASTPVYDETLPLVNTSGSVTIVTNANESGTWVARGI